MEQSMPNFESLSADKHSQLFVDEQKLIATFAKQHMVHVEVAECVNASTEFALFFSRIANGKGWTVSALCSFVPGQNLFSPSAEQWTAHYTPMSLRTLPLSMQYDEQNQSTVMLDTAHSAVSSHHGEALYNAANRPTPYLSNKLKQLDERVSAFAQTQSILANAEKLGLIQPVDLILEFANGEQQRINGLATVNENALKGLSAQTLHELNTQGVLAPMYSLLGSILQVNRLIRLHNGRYPENQIKNIKFETSKS